MNGIGRLTLGKLLLSAAILLGTACTSPFSVLPIDPSGGGSVVVRFGERAVSGSGGLNPATVFPVVDTGTIQSYRVKLQDGPAGAPVPEEVFSPGGEVLFDDVVPGDWTVIVAALDSEDVVILRGEAPGISVTPGIRVDVPVTLRPLETGSGNFSVTVEWPAEVEVSSASYRIDGGAWVTGSVVVDGQTARTEISGSREAGRFWLTIRLGGGRVFVDELVHVYAGLVSDRTFILTADDFSVPVTTEEDVIETIDTVIVGDGEGGGGSPGFTKDEEEDGTYYYVGTGGGTLSFDPIDAAGSIRFEVRIEDTRNGRVEVKLPDGQGGFTAPPELVFTIPGTNSPEYPTATDGFVQIEFVIPDTEFQVAFQGGNRQYTIRNFVVDLD